MCIFQQFRGECPLIANWDATKPFESENESRLALPWSSLECRVMEWMPLITISTHGISIAARANQPIPVIKHMMPASSSFEQSANKLWASTSTNRPISSATRYHVFYVGRTCRGFYDLHYSSILDNSDLHRCVNNPKPHSKSSVCVLVAFYSIILVVEPWNNLDKKPDNFIGSVSTSNKKTTSINPKLACSFVNLKGTISNGPMIQWSRCSLWTSDFNVF